MKKRKAHLQNIFVSFDHEGHTTLIPTSNKTTYICTHECKRHRLHKDIKGAVIVD